MTGNAPTHRPPRRAERAAPARHDGGRPHGEAGGGEPERVAKIIARRGLCSRREAERLIEEGQVLVDGRVVREQGCKAPPDAVIEIAAEGEAHLRRQLTVLLHKPPGVVSTQPEPGQVPAWKLLTAASAEKGVPAEVLAQVLADPASLSVAGRLDRASRGLLLLTQDGAVARQVIGGHGLEKVYEVQTAEPASGEQIRKLKGPLRLDGKPLLPMRVRRLSERTLEFRLVEGRKHQIRRVCRHVGLEVVDLFRRSIGPFRIGALREGGWRLATPEELDALAPPRRG